MKGRAVPVLWAQVWCSQDAAREKCHRRGVVPGGGWSEDAQGRGGFELQLREAGAHRGGTAAAERRAHTLKVKTMTHTNIE